MLPGAPFKCFHSTSTSQKQWTIRHGMESHVSKNCWPGTTSFEDFNYLRQYLQESKRAACYNCRIFWQLKCSNTCKFCDAVLDTGSNIPMIAIGNAETLKHAEIICSPVFEVAFSTQGSQAADESEFKVFLNRTYVRVRVRLGLGSLTAIIARNSGSRLQ